MSCCENRKPDRETLYRLGYMKLIITKEVQGFKVGEDVSHLGPAQKRLLLEWKKATVVNDLKKKKNEKSKVERPVIAPSGGENSEISPEAGSDSNSK